MKKKIGFSLLNNVITAFFPLLLIFVVSQRMDVSDFGKVSLWISLVVLFSGIADLGFSTAMVSDYNSQGPEGVESVVGNYNHSFYPWVIVYSSGFLLLLLMARTRVGLSLVDAGYLWLSVIIATIYRYLSSQYLASGKVRLLFLNTLGVAVVRLGSIGLLVWFAKHNLRPDWIFPLYLLGILLGLAYLLLDNNIFWRRSKKDQGLSRAHLRKVAWIGLTNSVILGRTRGDLAITQLFFPQTQVAIYAVANVLASGVNLFTGAVVDNYIPLLGRKDQWTGIRMMIRHLLVALPLVVLLCYLGWVISPTIVHLVAGARYESSIPILRILLFGYIGALAFVPLEAYLYVFRPSRVFAIKTGQLILFLVSIILLAPGRSVLVMGTVGLIVSIGGWILCVCFLYEAWARIQRSKLGAIQ